MRRPLAAGVLALALLPACRPHDASPRLAVVNGQAISAAQLDAERAFLQPRPPADADLLEDLIDQALILQVAAREGISLDAQARANAEEQARAGTDLDLLKASLEARGLRFEQWQQRVHRAALIDEVVRRQVRRGLDLSPQEIQDHYWEHLPDYRSPERRVLRQIYTRHRGDADKARRELELGEPFEQVAASRGQGPEAAHGGLLGAVVPRTLPKPLAEAAAKLKPGQRSGLIQSPWGWHILYLEAKLPAVSESLEQASPQARARLLRDKEQPVYQAWLAHLREQAVIERPAAPAAGPPSPKDKP